VRRGARFDCGSRCQQLPIILFPVTQHAPLLIIHVLIVQDQPSELGTGWTLGRLAFELQWIGGVRANRQKRETCQR
jgi:hypothetical protein